jgi:uncharacterized protein YcbK (DUF882 family)
MGSRRRDSGRAGMTKNVRKQHKQENAAYRSTLEERCTRARHEEYCNKIHDDDSQKKEEEEEKKYQEAQMKTLERINSVRDSRKFYQSSRI